MGITTPQIFQIGGAAIGLITFILGVLHVGDATTVASIGGAVASFWAAVGAILTGQTAQVKEVSQIPGVNTVRINESASPGLQALAADPQVKVEK
jgi:hypothetical protein